MTDRLEVTHRASVPCSDREVEVFGWRNHIDLTRWILNVSLHTELPSPYDRVIFPATVEARDFETASQLAAAVGTSRYLRWRDELNG